MRISRIETFTRDEICIVRVRTEDGHEGIGQTALYQTDLVAAVLHRQIAPHALDADADDLDALSDRCIERNYKYPGTYVCRALSGVDTALWDLRAKRKGKSVCELLGGAPGSVRVYASSLLRELPPEAAAAEAARLRDEGYTAMKVRIATPCGHDRDLWPSRTEAVIPAVRKAVGDGVELLADANCGYTPKRAIEVGRLLEDNGFRHFEEPCPYWEYEWTAQVAAALDVNVAGGEQDYDLAKWRRMIRAGTFDVVQPDVCYVGGLTRALRVAALADAAGLPCVPHSASQSLIAVFTLHLLGAIPNAGPYMEFRYRPHPRTAGLFDPPPAIEEGRLRIPDGPGWGVTINPAWLESAERRVSEAV